MYIRFPNGSLFRVNIFTQQGLNIIKNQPQRREKLKETLAKLRDDEVKPAELRELAESILSKLKEIR